MGYKLCPNNLEQLVQFGFKINWTLLQVGYWGNNFIPPQFTQKDVLLTCGEVEFDTRTRKAIANGIELSLTRKETGIWSISWLTKVVPLAKKN